MNIDVLTKANCYFGGGTAISFLLNEYRESVDIDFLVSSKNDFQMLRGLVSSDLGPILSVPIRHLREVRVERDKFTAFVEVDGEAIKIEFVHEGNTLISGHFDSTLGVPILSKVDMYTQKLLANADRGLDKAVMSRDIIDIAAMIDGWGDIPSESWGKALDSYGDYLVRGVHSGIRLVQDRVYLDKCLERMKVEGLSSSKIIFILDRLSAMAPLESCHKSEYERRLECLLLLSGASDAESLFLDVVRKEIATSGSAMDWAKIESETIESGIREHSMREDEVARALYKLSPSAVSPTRQLAISTKIERMILELNSDDDVDGVNPGDEQIEQIRPCR